MKPGASVNCRERNVEPPISAEANVSEANVKAAPAAGRNQNRRLLRGFTV